ncbi:hypothetical protein, partial [Brevibacterium samyangense]|uniref:hypothetical protein n=1 Tax=Brevibacterium samyangense TaxID=366888 RepID=UPI0031D5BA56
AGAVGDVLAYWPQGRAALEAGPRPRGEETVTRSGAGAAPRRSGETAENRNVGTTARVALHGARKVAGRAVRKAARIVRLARG